MRESRDPWKCPSCETVNVWSAESCRTCGNEFTEEMSDDELSVSSAPAGTEAEPRPFSAEPRPLTEDSELRPRGPFRRRRWNIFWIMLGIGIHVVSIHFGVFAIIKYLIEPDPELKIKLEQTIESANLSDPTSDKNIFDGASTEVQSKLSTIRFLVITLLVLVPLIIGGVIGFFTGNVLEGAASMGLSAVLIPLLNNAALAAVIWGPMNAGLGALGAFLGFHLGLRAKQA